MVGVISFTIATVARSLSLSLSLSLLYIYIYIYIYLYKRACTKVRSSLEKVCDGDANGDGYGSGMVIGRRRLPRG